MISNQNKPFILGVLNGLDYSQLYAKNPAFMSGNAFALDVCNPAFGMEDFGLELTIV